MNGKVTCALQDLKFGHSVVVSVRVNVNAATLGTFINLAAVTMRDPDGNTANNSAVLEYSVNAPRTATPTLTPDAHAHAYANEYSYHHTRTRHQHARGLGWRYILDKRGLRVDAITALKTNRRTIVDLGVGALASGLVYDPTGAKNDGETIRVGASCAPI